MLETHRGRKWEQEGSQGPGAAAQAARSFFLKGLLCLQGRDASDQHIVDVVLKMLQGEGGAASPSSQARSGHHAPSGVSPRALSPVSGVLGAHSSSASEGLGTFHTSLPSLAL